MKQLIAVCLTAALAGALTPPARAGQSEWATAGKVLTGVIAGAALVHALQPTPSYVCAPPPVVYVPAPPAVVCAPLPPPVVYAPAPVICVPRPRVVCAPPVYVRPAPVVSVHLGFGYCHPPHRGHGHR